MDVGVEKKGKFLEQEFKNRKDVVFSVHKGVIEVFCTSRYFYNEIKEPFERYGFKVTCGILSKRHDARR